jgi:hypothetical protein
MVSVEDLELFDLLQWLGKGRLVAELGHCNQSTVSRRSLQVQFLLGEIRSGDSKLGHSVSQGKLLTMERRIHQLYRLIKQSRLRLHATHWTNQLIHRQMPEAWIINPLETIEPDINALELLDCHVIDALITEGIQRPADDDPRYTCFDLYASPVFLVSRADTVLSQERGLTPGDIGVLARIAPQPFMCRQAHACARQLFEQNFHPPVRREETQSLAPLAWSIPTFDLVDPYAVMVDIGRDYSHRYVESLVVVKDNDQESIVHDLVVFLRSRFQSLRNKGMAIVVH